MFSITMRNGKPTARIYDSSRSPKEVAISFSPGRSKKELKKLELEMNLAYEEDWDPWRQSWKDYKLGRDPDAVTLGEMVETYLNNKRKNDKWSESYKKGLENFFDHFVRFAGASTQLSDLDEQVTKYLNRDISERSFDTYLSNINTFLNWLRDNHGVQIPKISMKYKNPEDELIFVTPEQLHAMLACYRNRDYTDQPLRQHVFTKYGAAFGLMFYMGLRSSEARKLRRKDYDRKNIFLRRKGGKKHWRYLMPEANNYFMELYNDTEDPNDLLIPVSYESMRRIFNKLVEHALSKQAQDKLKMHSLRSGGAMYYLHNFPEIDREWIKHFLSHDDYETTAIYVDYMQDKARETVERAYRNKGNSEYRTGGKNESGSTDQKSDKSKVAGS